MNALITGITGMVGSHLVDYLIENTEWNIYGFIRWNDRLDNLEHHFDRINKKDRIFLINGDLNDLPSVQSAINESEPDYVFHLAAQSYPKTSFRAPLETLQTNIIGTANLLESIGNYGNDNIVVHVCASSEIFGKVPKEKLPIDEECSVHPASPYAISKVGTDLLGRYYAEAFDIKIMTTRMFTHTGPRRGDVFSESTFAKQIAMIEGGLQEPTIYVGNLDSLRTYADVRDAVEAYFLLVTENPIGGEYYNIGGEYTCKIGDMLNYLISQSTVKNIKVEVDEDRLRPIDADLQVPNTEKFRKHTGWKPKYTFEETMNDLLEYWRNEIKKGRKFLNR
ncbi:GDP-mannose 4,6-dehydratase [Glaciecola sp.]|jgi:GDP-mannose 4,6-dehydratase|nr:GDP-mannose 4,6-dehydratase [Glaciecola sp.]